MLHELIYTNIIPIDSIGPGYKPCDQLTVTVHSHQLMQILVSTFGYLPSINFQA